MSDFCDKLKPLGRIMNLMDQGWTVWDCSPIYGPDGKVHLFFTRWKHRDAPDRPDATWYLGSEIAHAVADQPECPYEIVDTVIRGDGSDGSWDSSGVINAKIYSVDNQYALFYTGCTTKRHDTQAVGLLVSSSLYGPWAKLSNHCPIIAPEPDRRGFDGYLCNNPAMVQHPNGQVWVYYKGADVAEKAGDRYTSAGVRIGLAIADRLEGPYRKHEANPIIDLVPKMIEDPYVWCEDGRFRMIVSELSSENCVLERNAGLLFESADGIHWSDPVKGYPSPEELFGRRQRLEEPNVLFRDGKPAYLFNLMGACQEDPNYSGFVFEIDSE